jgi:hypothetical protein
VLTEALEQQDPPEQQAHRALLARLEHREHQEQKVTRETLAHKVFQ